MIDSKQIASVMITMGVLLAGLLTMMLAAPVGATALQIRPLTYPQNPAQGPELLKPGEVKKGFVEISNASHSAVMVDFGVKGFRQVDDQGSLEFYESETLEKGVLLDFNEIELGPREALRLYFLIDSKKLPPGDIFAAIFASSRAKSGSGITPSAQVGSLLFLQNGNGGPKDAAIAALNVPFFHFGDSVRGELNIRNTANPEKATGFFPKYSISLGPLFTQGKEFSGPLVFAGKTRNMSFELPTNRLGFYRVEASIAGDSQSEWIFVATGYWRIVLAGLIVLGAVIIVLALTFRKRKIAKGRKLRFGG